MANTQSNKKKKILIGVISGVAAAGIIAGVTIPLVMCSGKKTEEKVTVSFKSNETGVTITPDTLQVEKGSTFGSIKSKVQVSKKQDNNYKYTFDHWYKEGDTSKTQIKDDFVINDPITLTPFFLSVVNEEVIISFTPDPKTGDEGIVISKPSIVLKKGSTFANYENSVSATKTVGNVKWTFKWWYRDGYPETWEMSTDLPINEDITLHPYFVAPPTVEKHSVTFSPGDTGATITSESGEGEITIDDIKEGTSLQEVLDSAKVKASLDGHDFQYWAESLDPVILDEDTGLEYPPVRFVEEAKITSNITLLPYFTETPEQWDKKSVIWERNDEGTAYPTTFELRDKEYEFGTNHFVLVDGEDSTKPKPLAQGESISIEVDTPSHPGLISASVTTDPSSNKLDVKFTINPEIADPRSEIITFNLRFKISDSKGVVRWESGDVVGSMGYRMQPAIAPVQVIYHCDEPKDEATILQTEEGFKDYYFDSVERKKANRTYFTLSRKPTNDEDVVPVIEGTHADDVVISDIHVAEDNGTPYLDFDISFKKIVGLAYEHVADIELSFNVVYNSTGEITPSIGNKKFKLVFTSIKDAPYAVAINKEYTIENMATAMYFEVQVEKDPAEEPKTTYPCFKKGHFMTAENLSVSGDDNPVYFSIPRQGGGISDDPNNAPIEGNDSNSTIVKIFLKYGTNVAPPKFRTEYDCDIEFAFYNGKEMEEGQLLNKCRRQVKFVYQPYEAGNYDYQDYTNDEWAQAHSLGIIQKATNISTGEEETSIGTMWAISGKIDFSSPYNYYYFGTSYDIEVDSKKFQQAGYSNYKVGLFSSNAATEYIDGDSTKYISLDETDPYVYYFDPKDDSVIFNWEDRSRLQWNNQTGPAISVLKLKPHNLVDGWQELPEQSYAALRQHIYPACLSFYSWSETIEGLQHWQFSGLYTDIDTYDELPTFDKSHYAYGYVGGFNSTKLTYDDKTVDAVYWKGFQMNMGNSELDLVGPTTYKWWCKGSNKNLEGTNIKHVCPAFVMMWAHLATDEYFDDAGRGAMFLLRPVGSDRTLRHPVIAGVNWYRTKDGYGRSKLNLDSDNLTPYFDCFVYDTTARGTGGDRNLLEKYRNGQI